MNIIDYSKKPKQICFEANTEAESKLLQQVKIFLKKYVPKEAFDDSHGADFMTLNL